MMFFSRPRYASLQNDEEEKEAMSPESSPSCEDVRRDTPLRNGWALIILFLLILNVVLLSVSLYARLHNLQDNSIALKDVQKLPRPNPFVGFKGIMQ
ncbi:hypothetical protein BS17DRAFT_791128 [Gyrodon lividus]|nr:hypothetical protein BS17DRAFT_791128 [Gyrodon lividus]